MEFYLWHFSQSSSDSEERGHGGLLLQDQDQMILGHAVLKSQAACPVVRFHPIYCTNCGLSFQVRTYTDHHCCTMSDFEIIVLRHEIVYRYGNIKY